MTTTLLDLTGRTRSGTTPRVSCILARWLLGIASLLGLDWAVAGLWGGVVWGTPCPTLQTVPTFCRSAHIFCPGSPELPGQSGHRAVRRITSFSLPFSFLLPIATGYEPSFLSLCFLSSFRDSLTVFSTVQIVAFNAFCGHLPYRPRVNYQASVPHRRPWQPTRKSTTKSNRQPRHLPTDRQPSQTYLTIANERPRQDDCSDTYHRLCPVLVASSASIDDL